LYSNYCQRTKNGNDFSVKKDHYKLRDFDIVTFS